MEKLRLFFNEYYDELSQNVTWPTAEELQGNTVVVLTATFILAVAVALTDFAFNGALQFLYSLVQ